tara:strand:- start:183 stop:356 length:174 start_codon:yes stop_codon:yes gene_type:complete
MVEKSQLFLSSFTNKKGVTKLSANFTIEFAKKLASLEEESFKAFIENLNIELEKFNN